MDDAKLTAQELAELKQLQKIEAFPKGTLLIREGDLVSHYYTVVQGCVRTYSLLNDEEVTIDFYTEGQAIVPSVTTTRNRSPYFVACEEDCVLHVVDEAMEKAVFERLPRLKDVCRQQSERLLVVAQTEFAQFKSFSPEQRYQYLLQTRPELMERVPQYQIASYLGIKPESLSRLRKRMAQRTKEQK